MKRLLIIDALNMYFRAYIVDPSLSTNGQPIGGVKGFMKILQKLIRDTGPDEIVICWDGEGGSTRRKNTNKGYKEGRKPIRLNRDIRNLSENEEVTNKIWQMTRLVEYLNNLPIIQLMAPQVEADDVIAYVTQLQKYSGWQKIIVSSDKDFFQLCDLETVLYRPIQKQILNENRIVEEHGIHPRNFALARAIAGDKSDNLPGIRGIGLTTIAKRFPFLAESHSYSIDDLVEHCKSVDSKAKVYSLIVEQRKVVEENYRLMQLYAPSMSPQTKQKIRFNADEFVPMMNKTQFKAMMIEDGFGVVNFNDMFVCMKRIIADYGDK